MKSYLGKRCGAEGRSNVMIYEAGKLARPLPARLEVVNHSPTGFEWGYNGSGPAQLALAILCDHLGNPKLALKFYQEFKQQIIATIPTDYFIITDSQVNDWLKTAIGLARIRLALRAIQLESQSEAMAG